jgi:uncharacterized protein with PIN domain
MVLLCKVLINTEKMNCPRCDGVMVSQEVEESESRVVRFGSFYFCDSCEIQVSPFGDIELLR